MSAEPGAGLEPCAVIAQAPFGSAFYESAVALRQRVLRDPLGLRFSEEELQAESACLHFVALSRDAVVGCVMLVPETKATARLRQMAVDPAFRKKGLGARLVAALEAEARRRGFSSLILHAREEATGFYLKCGYRFVGERALFLGIPHREMAKEIG
jgi:N-acetylglutamate synthase-like GNAT family acetyltransferase